jgi:hypothetical protein
MNYIKRSDAYANDGRLYFTPKQLKRLHKKEMQHAKREAAKHGYTVTKVAPF